VGGVKIMAMSPLSVEKLKWLLKALSCWRGFGRGENKQYVIQILFYLLIYKKILKKKRII